MASTFISPSTPTTVTSSSINLQTPFLPKPSQLSIFKKKKPYHFASRKVVSCKATNENQNNGADSSSLNTRFDRRDLLIGLGGLYGATNLITDPYALAAPVQAPDLTLCGDATITPGNTVPCCPPTSTKIIDFKPPRVTKLRYRPAAQLVDAEYLAKFTEAMQRMRDLPDSDPRSFSQQAKVHCAYCNGGYDQVGFPDVLLQVHFSWLFFPFHRFYLYFYEKILGNLIGDPDFAMPFWNWDAPDGMPIPAIYVNPNSPLYDAKRNVDHQPPMLIDLNYDEESATNKEQIISNLKTMYREVVGATLPSLFHGGKFKAGDDGSKPPGGGTVEMGSHTSVHRWVGDPREANNEDMGNFYSAGNDPVFYAHHSNVDRMWSIWKDLPGQKRNDFTDTDWLDASFVFYDENANLVRCKVRDCLDHRALGYDYQRVNIPWLKSKPTPRFIGKGLKKVLPKRGRGHAKAAETTLLRNVFPIVLDKIVSIEVPRPQKSRTKLQKQDEEEVLVIENIQFDSQMGVKFDVYINDEDDAAATGPENSEFAGSFNTLPHNKREGGKVSTNKVFPLSELLEDLDVEGDDTIVVTLVPKQGKGAITIGNVKIDYIRE